MKRIALKIDVDTYHGTRSGAPALAELLQRHNAQATFFFSLGPDQGGREPRDGSLKRFHDISSRTYGRLLPSPDIGRRCKDLLRRINDAGFETGVHAWNRVLWEQTIAGAENHVVEAELDKACKRFEEIFGVAPEAHAAAGWRMNRHALRLTQRKGFSYASDCRGSHPFLPVIDGELIDCMQIPTTLPTLDELFVLEPGISPEQAMDRILRLSRVIPGDHVFTLRAELEGMKYLDAFDRLLTNWTNGGVSPVALRDIRSDLEAAGLPRHSVEFAEIPGRPGLRMIQGDTFP